MSTDRVAWLHKTVVQPTLDYMAAAVDRPWIASEAAQVMMLGIAATESDLRWTRQHGDGPARSYFQVEKPTATDLLDRYRDRGYRPAIDPFIPEDVPLDNGRFLDLMQHNQQVGCMLARLKMMDHPKALPDWTNIEGQANLWKTHYNSLLGAGTPDHYMCAFAKHNILTYAESEFGGAAV